MSGSGRGKKKTGQLIRYDAMCQAIEAAYSVDEVADIRDQSLAIEMYMRQQRNTEAERRACEIRLRAERKVGRLLKKLDRAQGKRSDRTSAQTGPKSLTEQLDEHGISQTQAKRFQQLADVPDDEFETALAAPTKPSTTSIVNGSKPKQDPMDPRALWLWGRLRDFEREGILDATPDQLLTEMTDGMQADVRRLSGLVADWLGEIN